MLAKLAKKLAKVSHANFHCECGKSYKHASSLSKHKSKCVYLQDEGAKKYYTDEIIPTNNVEILLKNILQENKAIHQKNDSILEENKILRQEIKNLKLGNTMINSNNNSFNINMFLNEKCKNAMNIEDFVEKIKLTLEDLQFTKENGYTKGISNIFIKNLNDMDITERPIHCSDQKRLQFYVKNENEWSKDKNNEKIDNSIQQVSVKQLKSIQDWVEANPDYLESTAKTEEYFTLVRSITHICLTTAAVDDTTSRAATVRLSSAAERTLLSLCDLAHTHSFACHLLLTTALAKTTATTVALHSAFNTSTSANTTSTDFSCLNHYIIILEKKLI
jgi:hypothetical protein